MRMHYVFIYSYLKNKQQQQQQKAGNSQFDILRMSGIHNTDFMSRLQNAVC